MKWIALPAIALMLALSACAFSSKKTASNAEEAITEQSHGHFLGSECEDAFDQESESGETSFYCSAAESSGRRFKLIVTFNDKTGEAEVVAWRCDRPSLRWNEIMKRPSRQCGKPLSRSPD